MNSGQARARLVQAGAALAAAASIAGCGSVYRPVVTPVGTSGPPTQPQSYAVAVSAPSPTTPGIATVVDYAGDSVLAYADIGPGPSEFTLSESGTVGYTLNSDRTLTNFPDSSTLQAKQVTFSTLPVTAQPVNLFSPGGTLWAADLGCSPGCGVDQYGNYVDIFTGSPQAFELTIPVAPTPVTIGGPATGGLYNYVISLNSSTAQANSIPLIPYDVTCNNPSLFPTLLGNGQLGEADAIELATNTIAARIPLGVCPDYAVQTVDNRRFFVLNRGGDATNPGGSITVINSANDTLDSCTPFQNQSGHWVTCHPSIPLPAGPVYAEYNAATQQLVVANYDSNTISVIDVSMDNYGNDANTYANNNCTVGGVSSYANCGAITGGFGTVTTIPVGNNPASVTVLADGSRAYVANQADGTVSIVNLSSYTVEKTLPVIGHPRTVVNTQNSQFGKVYVASPDSPYLTIIRTDLDIVDTTILLQGNIVDVRTSSENGSSGNNNYVSRNPGAGQPCYLPPDLETVSPLTLAACQTLP